MPPERKYTLTRCTSHCRGWFNQGGSDCLTTSFASKVTKTTPRPCEQWFSALQEVGRDLDMDRNSGADLHPLNFGFHMAWRQAMQNRDGCLCENGNAPDTSKQLMIMMTSMQNCAEVIWSVYLFQSSSVASGTNSEENDEILPFHGRLQLVRSYLSRWLCHWLWNKKGRIY